MAGHPLVFSIFFLLIYCKKGYCKVGWKLIKKKLCFTCSIHNPKLVVLGVIPTTTKDQSSPGVRFRGWSWSGVEDPRVRFRRILLHHIQQLLHPPNLNHPSCQKTFHQNVDSRFVSPPIDEIRPNPWPQLQDLQIDYSYAPNGPAIQRES